jgi:hypothetical protein
MDEYKDVTDRELQEYQLESLINLNKQIDFIKQSLVWITLISVAVIGMFIRGDL